MLRYDLFTSGKSSVSEFGSASNPNDFEYLIKYSPLQNIKIPEQPDQQVGKHLGIPLHFRYTSSLKI